MPKTEVQTGGGGDGGSKAGTTFVQADSACFRDLVQRLTGPSATQAQTLIKSPAPKPTQKLHERRKYDKPKIEIANPNGAQFHPTIPSSPPILYYGPCVWSCPPSPSSVILFSPPTTLPVSPISSPVAAAAFGTSSKRAMELNPGEEEKAIKEKRFYLHQSPRSKTRIAPPEPELLTLFPLTSPTKNDL